jgi:hypothetical protein
MQQAMKDLVRCPGCFTEGTWISDIYGTGEVWWSRFGLTWVDVGVTKAERASGSFYCGYCNMVSKGDTKALRRFAGATYERR